MRLTRLTLTGFRCFAVRTVVGLADLTALIGGNGSGKTAVLQALARMFSPDSRERALHRADFHVPKGQTPEEMKTSHLEIEARLEFPEIQDGSADPDTASASIPPVFEQMLIDPDEPTPYVRIRLSADWKRGNTPDGDIDDSLAFILSPEGTPPADEEKRALNSEQRSHIQVLYVPATRDPTAQLKLHAGTLLWRLLDSIKWSDGLRGTLAAGAKQIGEAFADEAGLRKIQTTLGEHWRGFHPEQRFSRVRLDLVRSELSEYLKQLEVTFRPTPTEESYRTAQLGDGLRSLLYLSLVSALLDIEHQMATQENIPDGLSEPASVPSLTILAIEEPENHLAPALTGRAIQKLLALSKKTNAQVALSSHTPALLRRIDPKVIRHLRFDADQGSSVVSHIVLPATTSAAHTFVREAVQAYPEIYFAQVVVLGEGDSEQVVLPRLLELEGSGTLDERRVVVAPLGGRHVHHFWRLLEQLNIPYVTLLDLDRERVGGGWDRVRYVLGQLHEHGRQVQVTIGGKAQVLSPDAKTDAVPLASCLGALERQGVFFSSPLDLDFLLLEAFPAAYKGATDGGLGPRVPDPVKQAEKYSARIAADVRRVLKDQGGDGATYTPAQQALFPWYSYLFLARSKPTTHILALAHVSDDDIQAGMPATLASLCGRVSELAGVGFATKDDEDGPPPLPDDDELDEPYSYDDDWDYDEAEPEWPEPDEDDEPDHADPDEDDLPF